MQLNGKRVALALGGGGARGCAHVGVVRELQARGAEIVAISGTSMGSVIGAMYATGNLDAYADWLSSLNQRDVFKLLDPAIRNPGMISGEKVMQRIREYTKDLLIEDLPIAYTAVATDLLSGKEVWFQDGPLDTAIRASIAVPSVFTPLVHQGRVLVDGGLLNQVPLTPLASQHFDILIASDVVGPPRDPIAAEKLTNVRLVDVMETSIQVMQRIITRYQSANLPADILIQMPGDMCGLMEFHKAADVIAIGQSTAAAVLSA